MTIDKRGDHYRIRQMYQGKVYTATVDHKPTQKEAVQIMAALFDEAVCSSTGNFNEFMNKYLDKCRKSDLKPSTVRGYVSMSHAVSDRFGSIRLSDISDRDLQKEINLYGSTRSPKSVKNYYNFLRIVLEEYRPGYNPVVKLPALEKHVDYQPTTDDIMRIIEYSKGYMFSVAIQLACLGLRRGEICALTIDDLSDDNVLTINKALSLDEHHHYVLSTPKTPESNRRITIPPALADQIRAQGYIYNGSPNSINKYLHECEHALGIPEFRLHMLRHFSAAYLHKLGFSDKQIMSWHGWSTASTMQNIYNYDLDPAEAKAQIAASYGNLF